MVTLGEGQRRDGAREGTKQRVARMVYLWNLSYLPDENLKHSSFI